MYDTEESPLSKMQAVRLTSEIWEGRLCNRNELYQTCTVNPKGRDCLNVDGTSNPAGASPSSPVWHQQGQVGCLVESDQLKGEQKGAYSLHPHIID